MVADVSGTGVRGGADTERERVASTVLNAVGQQAARLGHAEVTGFLAMAGNVHDCGLMVLGHAVNGWTEGITPLSAWRTR